MMKVFTKRINNRKGFTLIELIVVIAILGILSLVAIPKLTGFQDTAKKRADVNNARLIANAAAVAMAEGKTVTSGDALSGTSGTGLSDYLAAWPELQSVSGKFYLNVSGNTVSVHVTSASGIEIYPNTHNSFK